MLVQNQTNILNILLDDDESFEVIQRLLRKMYQDISAEDEIRQNLESLIASNHICCVHEYYDATTKGYGYRVVDAYEKQEFANYWFRITERGREELRKGTPS
jgi:hypothetical protein